MSGIQQAIQPIFNPSLEGLLAIRGDLHEGDIGLVLLARRDDPPHRKLERACSKVLAYVLTGERSHWNVVQLLHHIACQQPPLLPQVAVRHCRNDERHSNVHLDPQGLLLLDIKGEMHQQLNLAVPNSQGDGPRLSGQLRFIDGSFAKHLPGEESTLLFSPTPGGFHLVVKFQRSNRGIASRCPRGLVSSPEPRAEGRRPG
mmetsp:Transcript_77987/g.208472  ORF Transcript_77987/g.208472 Transcript_77987/m.208472 type:complete len:201 (-) Transcript_77987:117-719(-)